MDPPWYLQMSRFRLTSLTQAGPAGRLPISRLQELQLGSDDGHLVSKPGALSATVFQADGRWHRA